MNATFEPDAIVRHGEVNIGIAVALDGGLIVPVLRNADTLGLREIRVQSEALVQAARKNKLTAEQMTGGTFTISNLGMYGVREFDAILNLPEVAILAVGAAEKRPGRRRRRPGRRHGHDRHPDRRPPRRRWRDGRRVPPDPQGPPRRAGLDVPLKGNYPQIERR